MKVCSKCKVEKDVGEFHSDKSRNDGLCNKCKTCSLERVRSWKRNNPRKRAEERLRWKRKNPDKNRASNRRWRTNNPDKEKAKYNVRRARVARATVEHFTPDELRVHWITRSVNPRVCWYCEERPFEHLEHMKPLSRGGYHAKFNLVPACGRCNLSKGSRTVEEFIDYLEAQQRDEAA